MYVDGRGVGVCDGVFGGYNGVAFVVRCTVNVRMHEVVLYHCLFTSLILFIETVSMVHNLSVWNRTRQGPVYGGVRGVSAESLPRNTWVQESISFGTDNIVLLFLHVLAKSVYLHSSVLRGQNHRSQHLAWQ